LLLDCGGKRSATPLFLWSESGVASDLPPQSKTRRDFSTPRNTPHLFWTAPQSGSGDGAFD